MLPPLRMLRTIGSFGHQSIRGILWVVQSIDLWRVSRSLDDTYPASNSGGGGRDGERLTAMQVAVREATNAARKAAKTITWTAIEWRKTNAPERDTSGGAHSGGQGDAEPSIRVVVAGSRRAETRDTGADTVPRPLPVNIMRGTGLGNPFPMGKRGTDEALRDQVCEAFDTWLRLRTVPASAVWDTRSTPALIRQANGQPFSQEIAPRRSDEARTGNDAVAAMRAALNGRGNAKVVRLGCSPSCREGRLCHGDSLAAMARELIGVRDERRREGQQRTKAYQIGHLSLLRFRHGHERQVSQRTLDAVREAQGAGVEPWNTAEHDKAVHGPTPEGGTTNPMESEPPVSETYDDEGDDEKDENASADDEMAFIDDAFFELPDAATEEGAEGGGSQSQYSQQTTIAARRDDSWTD
ncbi:hypothetical protein EMIHUDRAFT_197491 [Emiliania huxleyi CCMP1516]|uniref:DUF4326 domain-containing protein n=2 Tax=Emiliania huxleyi TaxID=2903 RepID=A0A0D3IUE3_EMIH1|nr:hypothetical protein EMIHUDRAFT_197491 [Emiliania huxleyi CCMP1516]EOD14878.1 hypothetical protein EMIHUDRAFT_197491 [Emiliania huxleyi CCMP1516]|eukprot:XP_005767307.1 hypothetical protein EMIHUDRAFT_197491 [Emiliania huxleyi CCMP1516]